MEPILLTGGFGDCDVDGGLKQDCFFNVAQPGVGLTDASLPYDRNPYQREHGVSDKKGVAA